MIKRIGMEEGGFNFSFLLPFSLYFKINSRLIYVLFKGYFFCFIVGYNFMNLNLKN